jgi:hypothetical protein
LGSFLGFRRRAAFFLLLFLGFRRAFGSSLWSFATIAF